jgi:hypothetical protein
MAPVNSKEMPNERGAPEKGSSTPKGYSATYKKRSGQFDIDEIEKIGQSKHPNKQPEIGFQTDITECDIPSREMATTSGSIINKDKNNKIVIRNRRQSFRNEVRKTSRQMIPNNEVIEEEDESEVEEEHDRQTRNQLYTEQAPDHENPRSHMYTPQQRTTRPTNYEYQEWMKEREYIRDRDNRMFELMQSTLNQNLNASRFEKPQRHDDAMEKAFREITKTFVEPANQEDMLMAWKVYEKELQTILTSQSVAHYPDNVKNDKAVCALVLYGPPKIKKIIQVNRLREVGNYERDHMDPGGEEISFKELCDRISEYYIAQVSRGTLMGRWSKLR